MSRPSFLRSSAVSVSAHVYDSTTLSSFVYPAEDRVTVDVAGSGGMVTLFLPREEIARLRGALERAERDLTVGQDEMAAEIAAALDDTTAARGARDAA